MCKNRRFPGVALLLIAFLIPATPARAWNATGHQVIAEIAWRNLAPAVREKVLTLLKQHPHFAKRLDSTDPTSEPVDYALRVFQRAEKMREQDWTDLVLRRMRDAKALTGRHILRDFLNSIGFKLR